MEKARLPSSLGQVELGREEHVFEGEAELGPHQVDSSILEAQGFGASFNTPEPLALHL